MPWDTFISFSFSLFLDDLSHEASGSFLDVATSPSSTHFLGGFLMTDRNLASIVQSGPTGSSKGSREQPAFSSILTLLTSTAQKPPEHPSKIVARDNKTHQWPSNESLERVESSSTLPSSVLVSNQSSSSGLFPGMQLEMVSLNLPLLYLTIIVAVIRVTRTSQSGVCFPKSIVSHLWLEV